MEETSADLSCKVNRCLSPHFKEEFMLQKITVRRIFCNICGYTKFIKKGDPIPENCPGCHPIDSPRRFQDVDDERNWC